VLGTVNYMAPEMLSSSAGGDIRSDVYSLGVTLFEILTRRLPFDGDDIGELAAHHRQDLPGDVRAQVPHLPTRAARLVHRILAKDPLRRPLPREVIDRLVRLEVETFDERYAVA
jgi:serine/threonine protein kinase